ncbi:MAG: NUDIX domain-containing protein [Spirochaetaceae bacterium]|jgi:8-oxo-dGTP diphosphatase|nr:NUDIX domain-containing protein [Spirochaetaceae bacterium]
MKQSVAAIMVHEGRLFIAKRINGGDMGGKWEFPGGKVDEGENARDALVREIMEEFGVPARVISQIAHTSFMHNNIEHSLDAYLLRVADYCFTLTEHTDWYWADFDEIKTLHESREFTPSDYSLLPQIQNDLLARSQRIQGIVKK